MKAARMQQGAYRCAPRVQRVVSTMAGEAQMGKMTLVHFGV